MSLQALWDYMMPSAYADTVDTSKQYGKQSYRAAIPEKDLQNIDTFLPYIHKGVEVAEGNKNHGVLSVSTKEPGKVLNNSIINNFYRWLNAGSPGKFIDFMQKRWAPIGAENDPKGLNKNWAPNVRKTINTKYPDVYRLMKELNLVKLDNESGGVYT